MFGKFYLLSPFTFEFNHILQSETDDWVVFGTKIGTELNTVNSCYLEVQGTVWNNSRYPYLNISDLQNWEKNKLNSLISKMNMQFDSESWIYIENIVEKGRNCSLGAISPLFPQYFFTCC